MNRFPRAALAAALLCLLSPPFIRPDDAGSPERDVVVHRVGFTEDQFPGTATRDAEIAIDYWFKLMSDRDRSQQIANTKVFSGFLPIRRALRQDQLDIVTLLSRDYLEIRNELDLDPFAVATRRLNAYTEYALFVRKDRNIQRPDQLLGKTILYDVSSGADLGAFWFETRLLEEGYNPEAFADMRAESKASRAVLPVFFNQADACIVSLHSFENLAEMNPKVEADLVALEVSPPLLSSLVCFTDQLEEHRKPFLVDTLLTLHEDPQGQQVLNLFRRDRIVRFEPEQLESIEALVRKRRRLEKGRAIQAGAL